MTYFFLESNIISGLNFFSIILSIIILLLSYLLSVSAPDIKKLSSYQCGFDPYKDAKKIFNKKSFFHSLKFSQIFVELVNFELTTFLIIGFVSFLIIIAVKKAVAFFHLNKTLVLGQFKIFQTFLKENQHIIFAVFNIFLFVVSLTIFPFWDVFFVFNFWGDIYLLFYVTISLNLPIMEIIFGLIFLLRLYFNLVSWLLIYSALFFIYLYYVLDAFNVFLKMRTFFSEIFSDRKTFIFHQREEFLPFYILEKQYIVLLFFFW